MRGKTRAARRLWAAVAKARLCHQRIAPPGIARPIPIADCLAPWCAPSAESTRNVEPHHLDGVGDPALRKKSGDAWPPVS